MPDPGARPNSVPIRPGLTGGTYPERPPDPEDLLHTSLHALAGLAHLAWPGRAAHCPLDAIHEQGRRLAELDTAGLAEQTRLLRLDLHRRGLADDLLVRAFALVRETAGRTIGLRHYDTQLTGGWVLAHGRLAEMETGEGKTLTATLAAAAAALAGLPVHVVTVNDYLVERDARQMGPVYQALGLSVGAVTADMDPAARRCGYRSDVVYCTNKQLAFDYLRDRLVLGNDQGRLRLQLEPLHSGDRAERLFLRGLCFAIVDEADSVLIDEARTPLVISRQVHSPEEEQLYRQALDWAGQLTAGADFVVDRARGRVQLSDGGSDRLAALALPVGGLWGGARRREELVGQALSALHLYERDRHYLVQGGRVQIIDENTGRTMADRSWERGLHQMIEIREGLSVSGRNEHIARLTYQRFFRRYQWLAGMTGTAREVRRELWSIYRLAVVRIPPHRPCQRRLIGARVHADSENRWAEVVRRIRDLQAAGRPVLVGTRSVADSEHLGELLQTAGIAHQVLNARQDAAEAAIVARAGIRGAVTVATNMAGRGTDILLGAGVAEHGGLHVIATERNDAGRIDRQLFGRCGRQGDPGSCELLLSLEDDLLRDRRGNRLLTLLTTLLRRQTPGGQRIALAALRLAQRARERRHRALRRSLLRLETRLGQLLAFSGRME